VTIKSPSHRNLDLYGPSHRNLGPSTCWLQPEATKKRGTVSLKKTPFRKAAIQEGMTGISLHMEWPLTSQSHSSASQREQLESMLHSLKLGPAQNGHVLLVLSLSA
jgi:hypothetical protein